MGSEPTLTIEGRRVMDVEIEGNFGRDDKVIINVEKAGRVVFQKQDFLI